MKTYRLTMKKKLINLLIFMSLFFLPASAKSIPKFFQNEYKSENVKESEISRRAVADRNRIWDDGVIPYEIDPSVSESLHNTVLRAMEIWEMTSCVKFVPAEPNHKYSILITSKGNCGCCSNVGKWWRRQEVVLHPACNAVRIALHELGHAMGFYHEQSRPDRDKYIKVLYANVKKGHEGNFQKLTKETGDTLGLTYDFNSIMHYSSYGFSTGIGKYTMQALNRSMPIIGENFQLSEIDIAAANKLYRCPKCYFKLNTKSNQIRLSASNFASGKAYCQWFIERDPGEFIEFYVEDVDISESEGCSANYLQFQDGYLPKSPVIDHVCGRQETKKSYKTLSNNLLITYKSSSANSKPHEFVLMYRVVCNGIIKGDYGRIQSPNFNNPYLFDSTCQWILKVPLGAKLVLTFETFHIKYDENCQSDYVEVIDDSGNELLRSCGNEVPGVILSDGNELTVRYVSEKRTLENRFSAHFTKEINECELPDRGGCRDICINTIGSYRCECYKEHVWLDITNNCEKIINSCGGTVKENETIIITSPGYPDPYPSNIDCIWNINHKNSRFQIITIDMNKSNGQCIDRLDVKIGYQLLPPICDINKGNILNFSNAPSLKIRFTSMQNINRQGFKILIQPM